MLSFFRLIFISFVGIMDQILIPRCLFKIPRRNMPDRLRPPVVVVTGGLVIVEDGLLGVPNGLVGEDDVLVGVPDGLVGEPDGDILEFWCIFKIRRVTGSGCSHMTFAKIS